MPCLQWEQWTDRLSVDHHYRSNVATWFQSLAGIGPTSTAYETLRVRPYSPTVAVNSQVPKDAQDTEL
ncbi:hypothetical protein [Streptomyces sp. SID13726]|uniref:hypothetical protein n=1 Tax=Streptomyces sp. SID13726 TaxID=2706058 RepID=UPI001EF2C0A2|nr:hypothetical protein [Streptomyces sp. SID13726]